MTDRETYINRWESHINELERLNWNLDAKDHEKVREIMAELEEIVETCAENKERQDDDVFAELERL